MDKTDIEEGIKICKSFIEENKDRPIILHKSIENILADRERLQEQVEYDKTHILTPQTIKLNYIPKQVIKDKIEELDKEEQELQNNISEEEREELSDANISWELSYIEAKREVLQDLLKTIEGE